MKESFGQLLNKANRNLNPNLVYGLVLTKIFFALTEPWSITMKAFGKLGNKAIELNPNLAMAWV